MGAQASKKTSSDRFQTFKKAIPESEVPPSERENDDIEGIKEDDDVRTSTFNEHERKGKKKQAFRFKDQTSSSYNHYSSPEGVRGRIKPNFESSTSHHKGNVANTDEEEYLTKEQRRRTRKPGRGMNHSLDRRHLSRRAINESPPPSPTSKSIDFSEHNYHVRAEQKQRDSSPRRSTRKSTKKKKNTEVASSRTLTDKDFVDYTVVPLLLRSGLRYESAAKFGSLGVTHYTREEFDIVMMSPANLLSALRSQNIHVSATSADRLETDKFWSQGSSLEKSYVYFRSDPRATKSLSRTKHKHRSSASNRKSAKNEFIPTFALRSDNEVPELKISDHHVDRLNAIARLSTRSKKNAKQKQMLEM